MFSTSNGSSPQTVPTTPESISNNSDDYTGGGGSSNNEWGTSHDSDAWPTGHHDWSTSSQNSDNLNATGAEWSTTGGMGWVNNDWANGSNDWSAGLGLGFLNNNAPANISDMPSDEQAMPLHDLIDDSLLSNSPVATVGTVPNHIINTAWLNRNSSGNNLALNTNGIGLGMTSSPVTSPTSAMSHKSSLAPQSSSTISPASSQLHSTSMRRNPSFPQLVNQHQVPPPTSADPTTLFAPFPSSIPVSMAGNHHLGMVGNRHSLATSNEVTGLSTARPASGLNEHGAGLFTQAAQSRSMYQLTVHDVPPKSRVETQVRLRIELDDISSPSAINGVRRPPEQWKFIRVPKTASVKTRNVKGQCEPDQSTVLTLSASIFCATNAAYKNKPVPCCENCQKREEKRNSKKASSYTGGHAKGAAARGSAPSSRHATAPSSKNVTPATSESELGGPHPFSGYPYDLTNGYAGTGPSDENYVSPIDFTCQQMLDFTGGTAQLCFRVICYCRHYKEKTGFIIRLTLKDYAGYTVGEVDTTPIMIMDDHKSTGKPTPAHTADEEEVDTSAHARRRKRPTRTEDDEDDLHQAVHSGGVGAIRNKPRPTRMTALTRASGSSSKPVASGSGTSHAGSTVVRGTASESPLATTAPSSPSGFSPPPTTGTVTVKTEMEGVQYGGMPLFQQSQAPVQRHPNSGLSSPLSAAMPTLPMQSMVHPVNTFTNPAPPPPPNPYPNITRLVPNSGPTTGGIEVILLGANFSPESLAGCYIAFGHQCVAIGNAVNAALAGIGMDPNGVMPGAQVLSENTLHCTLPPSQVSGPVTVKLLGVPLPPGQTETDAERLAPIFTYTEEGDRDLMMKALQILGLRNGQMQDARSIAMNIIHSNTQQSGLMNMSNAGTDPSYMPMNYSMNSEPSAPKRIEDLVINVLRSAQNPETGVIKDISTSHSPTGQTLLHLSSAMGLSKLTRALINWGAEVNLQDRNGFTPVHFACFYGRLDCIDLLVRVGRAHLEGKDVQGRTPFEVCKNAEVSFLLHELRDEVETRQPRPAVASEFESGGEGDDEGDDSSACSDTDEDGYERDEENNSDNNEYDGYNIGRTGTLRQRKQAATPISGAAPPQPMAHRISRVNSFASNASHHSHKSQRSSASRIPSRTGTPFAPEMTILPLTSTQAPAQAQTVAQPQPQQRPHPEVVTTPTTPTPTAASVPLPEPVSPGSPWRLPRGVPNMPWPMQLPAGWQFPAVPGMPQFGLRRGAGNPNGEDGESSKKDEPTSEADAQVVQAQMFMWMMEYLRRTVGWDFNMLQQQAQARSAGINAVATTVTEVDNDPPPYSPGGVGGPEEKLLQASQAAQVTQVAPVNQVTQVTPAPVTPTAPVVLEEPPSPLTLDSPFGSALGAQNLLNLPQVHNQPSQLGQLGQQAQVQPNVLVQPISGKHRHHSHQQPHRHQSQRQQLESEYVEYGQDLDSIPPPASPSKTGPASTAVVRRREKKKQDKMLIYFWIPVLILVIAWASYKSLHNAYRYLMPSQHLAAREVPTRTNIEV